MSGGGAMSPTGEGSIEWVQDRLDALTHSISADVLTGLERECTKIKGWMAMLEVRHGEDEATVIKKLELKHKYQQLDTAIKTFKTALGPLYKPPAKTGPFADLFRSDSSK